jgi:hypothetical protein
MKVDSGNMFSLSLSLSFSFSLSLSLFFLGHQKHYATAAGVETEMFLPWHQFGFAQFETQNDIFLYVTFQINDVGSNYVIIEGSSHFQNVRATTIFQNVLPYALRSVAK